MTADTEAKQTQGASKPPREPSPYTERFSTWLTPDIGQRLRHLAVLRHLKVNHLLTEVLDRALPTFAELGGQLQQERAVCPEVPCEAGALEVSDEH